MAVQKGFDRSYLPEALFEFVVITDTHHIVDPNMYPASGDSVTPELTHDWSARGDWALSRVAALNASLVFHVGDLAQEYPGHDTFERGRRAARTQFDRAGVSVNFVPGNMDIGDKPDPTMPAGWVRVADLDRWRGDFGPTYYSITEHGCHFVALNSQIFNTTFEEASQQRAWLEADLAAHAGARTFLFFHIPLFLVDEDEPGLGSYDVLDNPDRGWLLELIQRYQVEAVFTGHTHFQVFNRYGPARLFTLPSTTTTRPGFYEAFAVAPPSRGWADLPKLGFVLVRVLKDGLAVHLVRTEGRTGDGVRGAPTILTATTRELPLSPLGAYLRLPLVHKSDGAIAYPNHVRHRIRDDYPLLSCLELGLRHVRFPVHDLDEELQRSRLRLLQDEGVGLTAVSIWANEVSPPATAPPEVDVLEVQLAGRVLPTVDEVMRLSSLRLANRAVSLAPIVMERTTTVHSRSRTGYIVTELTMLDDFLQRHAAQIDRAVCAVDGTVGATWSAILALGAIRSRSIGGLDIILRFGTDDQANCRTVAEGMMAAATLANGRLFLDPLQELDRTATVMGGLLDRLSNPRPPFHVARVLNTVLFSGQAGHAYAALDLPDGTSQPLVHGIADSGRELWLVAGENRTMAAKALSARLERWKCVSMIDLEAGSRIAVDGTNFGRALTQGAGRLILITATTKEVDKR